VELELEGHGCCFLCCLRNRERDGGRGEAGRKEVLVLFWSRESGRDGGAGEGGREGGREF
jgi:hypothetical protein